MITFVPLEKYLILIHSLFAYLRQVFLQYETDVVPQIDLYLSQSKILLQGKDKFLHKYEYNFDRKFTSIFTNLLPKHLYFPEHNHRQINDPPPYQPPYIQYWFH